MAKVEKVDTLPGVPGGIVGENPEEKFKHLNLFLHSPGGMGKTTIIASACLDERTRPILVLDIEGGAPIRFAKMPKDTYTILKIESIKDINKVYEYLRRGDHPYKSVAIDSATELQKIGLNEFVYGPGGVDTSFSGNVINIKTAEIQHWGKSANQMGMLFRYFRDLKLHVFFTALTVTQKDELTGAISYKVSLPGKQSDEMPGIPDIVGYVSTQVNRKTKEEERVIYFQPTGRIVAKDRTDALGLGMQFKKGAPIVTEILDKIYAAYGIE